MLWLASLLLLAACVSGGGSNPPVISPAAHSTATAQPTATAAPVAASASGLELSAQAADSVITLSWQPLAGVRGYNVYRDGSSVPLNAVALAETRYDDIGISNGRVYTYTVAAVDQAGQIGARSAVVAATPGSH